CITSGIEMTRTNSENWTARGCGGGVGRRVLLPRGELPKLSHLSGRRGASLPDGSHAQSAPRLRRTADRRRTPRRAVLYPPRRQRAAHRYSLASRQQKVALFVQSGTRFSASPAGRAIEKRAKHPNPLVGSYVLGA